MDQLTGWLGPAYLWVKAVHVIVVIFWMAGLFILPRYLVHQAADGLSHNAAWAERTARLRRIILTPALVVTWLLGIALTLNYGLANGGWLHAKLVLVVLLSGYHGWMAGIARRMAAGERPMAEARLRLLNEAPAAFTVLIVLLAVAKPF